MPDDERPSILLVEDEAIVAAAGARLLGQNGYGVTSVRSGEDAVGLMDSGVPVDMILMDIELGDGIDGTEAARTILARHDVPVVFVSAHTSEQVLARTEQVASYGYVAKSSGDAALIAAVRTAFRLHGSDRIHRQTFEHSINALCVHRMLYDDQGHPSDCLYLEVNRAFGVQTGLAVDDVVGTTIRSIYPGDEADEVIALYAGVLESETPVRREIYFGPTGHWFELSVFPIDGDTFTVVFQKVTDRHEMENRLRRSETRYRTLVENLNEGVWQIDRDSLTVYVNRQMADMLGYSVDEMLGRHVLDFVDVRRSEQMKQALARRELGVNEQYETEYLHKNGQPVSALVSTAPLHDDSGEYAGAVACLMNTTERKRSRQEILAFKTISDEAVHGNAITELDGTVVYVNDSFARMHGYTPDELIGRNLTVFHSEAQRPSVRRYTRRLIETGSFGPAQVWHVRRDGMEIPTLMGGTLIRNIDDRPAYMAATAVDISQWMLAEQALRESEARLAAFTRALPDLGFIYDGSGRCLDVLTKQVDLLYRPPDELIGALLHEVLPQEVAESIFACILGTLESGELRSVEYSLEIPLGIRWFEGRAAVMDSSEGELGRVALLVRDITDRKSSEQAVSSLLHEKELLLRETHHRVKNNMGVIRSLLTLQAANESATPCGQILEDSANRVWSMMMLYDALFRSDNRSEVGLREYIEPFVTALADQFEGMRDVRAHFDIDDIRIGIKIIAPIGIMVNEMVTNSMKHAFPGNRTGTIRVTARVRGRRVTLTYGDDGVGLPESVSLDATETFGLQLIRLLAEQIGGVIELTRGKGTHYTVTFDT